MSNDDKPPKNKSWAEALESLTPREQRVLRARFGITDESSDNVTDRIAQIMEKANNEWIPKIQANREARAAQEAAGERCSFCGVTKTDENKIAKTESGKSICAECLQLCQQALKDDE